MTKKNKKNNNVNNYIFFGVSFALIFMLCIGYSKLATELTINGVSSINKNIWDLRFNHIVVTDGSVTSLTPPIINDSKDTVSFNAELDLPGDFYEFTVDIWNYGTIDAIVENVVKMPDLTEQQKVYLKYTITYANGNEIKPKELLPKGEHATIKVRLEYIKDISKNDLVTTYEELDLMFSVNYIQDDGTGINAGNSTINYATTTGDINEVGTIVIIGTEKFYTIGTDGDNVKLFAMYNLYVGSSRSCTGSVSRDSDGTYKCSTSTYVYYTYTNPTGMQRNDMNGEHPYSKEYHGLVPFSDSSQHGTNNNSYVGSIVEGYVNNYKLKLENNFGVPIEEARLITVDELQTEGLDCSSTKCERGVANSLIFNTSFWTATPVSFNTTNVKTVRVYSYALTPNVVWEPYANISEYIYSSTSSFGVRPVIVIDKRYIKQTS